MKLPSFLSNLPTSYTPEQRKLALAFAEALIPGSAAVQAADERTVTETEAFLQVVGPEALNGVHYLMSGLDKAAILGSGARFSRLSAAQQELQIQKWLSSGATRPLISLIGTIFKLAHFDRPDVYESFGRKRLQPAPEAAPRYLENVFSAKDWDPNEVVECDVVVVGTGAGGAVVGRELTKRGYGVAFVEEGSFLHRSDFKQSVLKSFAQYYRTDSFAIGNAVMPVYTGRMVGGSTTLNTATCFRAPRWIHDEWAEKLGSDEFTEEAWADYYERVENELNVQDADIAATGPIRDIIARGCDALGWHHGPIRRNAPECRGEGFCTYGCPTDAKRSMNMTYIPSALKSGAMLLTEARAEQVIIENGKAVGLKVRSTESGAEITVRAKLVVMSGGAVPTPLFLADQGLCNTSGELGKNLTLHPSANMSALFDEYVGGGEFIPQGYGTQQFLNEGLLLSGSLTDDAVFPSSVALHGRQLIEAIELRNQIGSLGVLCHDHGPGGYVKKLASGRTLMRYDLVEKDCQMLHKGMLAVIDIFKAAGARRFYPLLASAPILDTEKDIEKFRKMKIRPQDLVLTSYHPIGTCKMGRDPKSSVVDLNCQTHDVPNLYLVDGSSLPGPPAVNPQIAIMALATRAADHIANRLG